MMRELNELVPADDLHWDAEAKCFGIISKKETDAIVRACMRSGMEEPRDILKVVNEYEVIRAGNLLFNRFISGSISISGFDESGSPIFESKSSDSEE